MFERMIAISFLFNLLRYVLLKRMCKIGFFSSVLHSSVSPH